MGWHSGAMPSKFFCSPPILLCPEKFVLNIQKKKNIALQKSSLPHQTLKPGYGPACMHIATAL